MADLRVARVRRRVIDRDGARQQLQLAAKADPNFAPAVEWLAAFDAPAMPNPIQTVGFEQPKPKTN